MQSEEKCVLKMKEFGYAYKSTLEQSAKLYPKSKNNITFFSHFFQSDF